MSTVSVFGGKMHIFSVVMSLIILINTKVRTMVTDLQNTTVLAKIEGRDLIALDAKYHLTQLMNQHWSLRIESQKHPDSLGEEKKKQARVFSELLTLDSLNAGYSTCLVFTLDTNVVVILDKFHLNLSAKIGMM